ncbi:hypothetical protein IAT38_000471 [Cryptococcus sp. DSM 104549]
MSASAASSAPPTPNIQASSLAASTSTLVGSPTERSALLKGGQLKKTTDPCNSESGEEEEAEGEEVLANVPGEATFNQTLMNTLGDLIGTGILASPIAIAHAGWVMGPILLMAISMITLWTLKIIIRVIQRDSSLRNFVDFATYGIGPKWQKWLKYVFIGDCCIWIIALMVLFSDMFETVLPIFTSNQWKVVGLLVIVPLNFVPLRWLSWSSGLGVATTWTLVAILIFTGLATKHTPGSIWEPAPTDIWPTHGFVKFGLSFGLLLSGFGGHFLLPNLIRDMKHPEQAEKVANVSYAICFVVYGAVAVFGYVMFGRDVSDEISRDLAKTSAFSPLMAKIAVWMVAINPITKMPLALRPLTDIIFKEANFLPTIFVPKAQYVANDSAFSVRTRAALHPANGSYTEPLSEDAHHALAVSNAERAHNRREKKKAVLRALTTIVLLGLFVVGALLFPSFETVMSIMGGGMSVVTCILVPIAAGAGVWGWRWYSRLLFGLSAVVCVVGVVCALLNNGDA